MMIDLFFQVLPISLLSGGIYLWLRCCKLRKSSQAIDWGQEALRLAFVCYLTGLVGLVLAPPNFFSELTYGFLTGFRQWPEYEIHLSYSLRSAIWEMLAGAYTSGSWVRSMLVGNLLMFLPMGFFLAVVARRNKFRTILPWAIGLPLCIEAVQPLVCRSFDVDDIFLNAWGIFLGWCVGMISSMFFTKDKS